MNTSETTHYADSPDIFAQLADAVASPGPIDNARDLIAEAEQAIETERAHSESLRAKSLDPTLSSEEAASVRVECGAAVFRVPGDDGHLFHGMRGRDSMRSWAAIPQDRGQV